MRERKLGGASAEARRTLESSPCRGVSWRLDLCAEGAGQRLGQTTEESQAEGGLRRLGAHL